MLEPDIEGRLQSLQSEQLAAVLDYMLGEHKKGEPRASLASSRQAGDHKTKHWETVSGAPRA